MQNAHSVKECVFILSTKKFLIHIFSSRRDLAVFLLHYKLHFSFARAAIFKAMFTKKSSNLNPLANTFIPSYLISEEVTSRRKVSTQSLASKLIKDLIDNKRTNCDSAVTKDDFMGILEKLIPAHYEIILDDSKLMSYLATKLPNRLSIKLVEKKAKECAKDSNKSKSFDLSVFKLPEASPLLATFWGLYRHQQAMRPMLSLTCRPEKLKDPIWSVTTEDLKIWNPRAVETTCNCPPMFGYSVPEDFFGNPFNLTASCSKKDVHLNHYPDTIDGNEFTFLGCLQESKTPFKTFAEYEETLNVEYDLEYYSKQMKDIVSSVCNLIKVGKDTEYKCSALQPNDIVSGNFADTLWDTDSKLDGSVNDKVEDDDCHPLLDACPGNEFDLDTEVSGTVHEVEEMLQKSLTTEFSTDKANLAENAKESANICDPPCSVWCNAHPISRSSSVSSDIISFLNDTTDFLLNNESFASKEPGSKLKNNLTAQKACFRRSFSVNDCDMYDDLTKVDQIPQVSTSTREALSFLRKDPINFFKRLRNRNDSWKDNDSGIMSQSSSQEEISSDGDSKVPGDICLEYEDPASMWGFFTGEGSLWQPLQSSTQPIEQVRIPHKRVRDLRRQRSIN